MKILRPLLIIIFVITAIAIIGELASTDTHIVINGDTIGMSFLEPFIAAIVIAFTIAVLIATALFVAVIAGSVVFGVIFLLLCIAALVILPALTPLLLLIGLIYLIVQAFKSSTE